jgi:two-component system cell cycle sensor histidine kinase/response regulator CckA
MGQAVQQIVLLVDDESSTRTFVKCILQSEGLEVLEAGEGVDALALLRCLGRPVDLLVTDIKMPRMMGTDLARVVRTDYPTIPVVYISGER